MGVGPPPSFKPPPTLQEVTGKLVEQKLYAVDRQVQLVHVVLTEVADLEVPAHKVPARIL